MRQPCTTPVPNVIFDIYLKELNSSELKVLLVVIRQTLGWVDRRGLYGRKDSDWISGSQLMLKTGSSKRAISSAIDSLVKKRIIEVIDYRGYILNNPESRQGKTKLFYRLNSIVYNPVDKPMENIPTNAKFTEDFGKLVTTLVQKMHITKETYQN
jgi:hypothetical protein